MDESVKGRLSEMVGLGHLIKAHRTIFIVILLQTEPQNTANWSEEHRAK